MNQAAFVDISEEGLSRVRQAARDDPAMQSLVKVILRGWQETRSEVPSEIREFLTLRGELTAQAGVIYRGQQVVIPCAMRPRMLDVLHSAHVRFLRFAVLAFVIGCSLVAPVTLSL